MGIFSFLTGDDKSESLQTEDGRGVATGAVAAVQNPSDRATGNSSDMALSSEDTEKSAGSISDKIGKAAQSMCEELGIPPEYANKLMGMLGMNPQMIDMLVNVLQKLQESGSHPEGSELGNPKADLAPPSIGQEQTGPDLQLADRR